MRPESGPCRPGPGSQSQHCPGMKGPSHSQREARSQECAEEAAGGHGGSQLSLESLPRWPVSGTRVRTAAPSTQTVLCLSLKRKDTEMLSWSCLIWAHESRQFHLQQVWEPAEFPQAAWKAAPSMCATEISKSYWQREFLFVCLRTGCLTFPSTALGSQSTCWTRTRPGFPSQLFCLLPRKHRGRSLTTLSLCFLLCSMLIETTRGLNEVIYLKC